MGIPKLSCSALGKFKIKNSHTETDKKSYFISLETVLLPSQHSSVLLRGEAQFMVSPLGKKEKSNNLAFQSAE